MIIREPKRRKDQIYGANYGSFIFSGAATEPE